MTMQQQERETLGQIAKFAVLMKNQQETASLEQAAVQAPYIHHSTSDLAGFLHGIMPATGR